MTVGNVRKRCLYVLLFAYYTFACAGVVLDDVLASTVADFVYQMKVKGCLDEQLAQCERYLMDYRDEECHLTKEVAVLTQRLVILRKDAGSLLEKEDVIDRILKLLDAKDYILKKAQLLCGLKGIFLRACYDS